MSATDKDTPSMSVAEADKALTAPGQLFEMEELDIRGVPTRTWKNAPTSLRAVLDMSLAHGDAPFVVYEDERTTFAEHYRIACTLAQRLRTTFGIAQGDRIAIIMRNLPEWIMAFWGATLAGAIVVPLNAWWSGEELRYGLEDSGSKIAFVDTERAERIRPFLGGLSGLGAIVVTDEHRTEPKAPLAVYEPPGGSPPVTEWPFPLALGPVDEAASPPDVTIGPEDDATIFYTSGTTGRPKGAVGTHRNMCTNLMSLFFINTRGSMRFGTPALEPVDEKAQPAFLLSVPLFHATGCHSVMVSNVAAGGKIVMMHHFDPDRGARADRAGEDRDVRRRTGDGHAGARLPQLLEIRHLVHPRRLLWGRPRPARPGPAHPRGVARGPTLQRLRADRDVLGHLHDLGRGLRGETRERRSRGAGVRRGHRARGLQPRRAR